MDQRLTSVSQALLPGAPETVSLSCTLIVSPLSWLYRARIASGQITATTDNEARTARGAEASPGVTSLCISAGVTHCVLLGDHYRLTAPAISPVGQSTTHLEASVFVGSRRSCPALTDVFRSLFVRSCLLVYSTRNHS